MIPKPQWKGVLFAQDKWQPESVQRSADGTRWDISGTAEWEHGGIALSETIEIRASSVRISYRLVPLAAADAQSVLLIVRAPVQDLAGRGSVVLCNKPVAIARLLPQNLPDPYHITRGRAPDWLAWQVGDALTVIRPLGSWLAGVSVQDDRRFNIPHFEAQLAAADSARLEPGREIRLAIEITARSADELEKEGIVLAQAETRWDLARVELSSRGELAIGPISWSAREGPRWKPVELTFDLSGTWDNPFDPDEIDVYAVIRGPGGIRLKQPAFACHDFESLTPGGDILKPRGSLHWRVRWTPTAEGSWRLRIVARSAGKRVSTDAGVFQCSGSFGHGFIRRCPSTPYYLQFDDGTPYFAIGENICWNGDNLVVSYRRWFERLGAAGGNYCRIWLVRWNMGLEWSNTDTYRRGCYYGLGRYSLDNAWRLDRVMQTAAENGIYVMLCLGYHGELREKPDYFHAQCWQYNPYNAALGGPCQRPQDFWTDPAARKLYKQRLRYYLARWGAYPNVLSWEFWNEVWALASWVDEMASYLADTDIHRHLRTTTYGNDEVWHLDSMDYAQAHHYGVDDNLRDSGPVIAATSWRFTEKFRKPFMMGEFGIDWKRSDASHDPQGRATNFHNGIWAALASRSFGTAAIWYWDNYVDKLNLYGQFAALARFARKIDWARFNPTRPKLEAVVPQVPADSPGRWASAAIHLPRSWQAQPDQPLRLTHAAELIPAPGAHGKPSRLLFGPAKKDIRSALKVRLDMPADGQLAIRVGTVSAAAELVVRVDGREVFRKAYRAGPPGQGPYKETKYYDQWKIWQSRFDEDIQIPLTAGDHLVELANERGDWLELSRVAVSPYLDTYRPETYLLSDGRLLVGWLHNRDSVWWTDRDGREPKELPSVQLIIGDVPDGSYRVLWYDTWRGEFFRQDEVGARNGRLVLVTPPFKRDIALITTRQ